MAQCLIAMTAQDGGVNARLVVGFRSRTRAELLTELALHTSNFIYCFRHSADGDLMEKAVGGWRRD